MRRAVALASLIAGCLACAVPVDAMILAPDRRGDALVFPYYTVNDGLQTLISVVNTTDAGKAIALNFREGSNSRITQRLYLYLAPHDVWTGAVFYSSFGRPGLVTLDPSCTVPAVFHSTDLPRLANGARYLPFGNFHYSGANADAAWNLANRNYEGHFEMIEMGEISDTTRNSLAAIRPGEAGIPLDCSQIEDAWRSDLGAERGYWALRDPNTDISSPTGGLYGFAAVVDVLDGVMFGYAADAISGFSAAPLHFPPSGIAPDLASAVGDVVAQQNGIAVDLVIGDQWEQLRFPVDRAIDAVSALFMADAIHNDYVTAASLGADSEWVLSFPTKRHYTDLPSPPALAPFPRVFGGSTSGGVGEAAVWARVQVWDRHGQYDVCADRNDPRCPYLGLRPPSLEPRVDLDFAVNVLTFLQDPALPTRILGSARRVNLGVGNPQTMGHFPEPGQGHLWMRLYDPQYGIDYALRPDNAGRQLRGLPVQGFLAVRYTNSAVTPGVLANYAAAFRHQVTRSLLPAVPARTADDR